MKKLLLFFVILAMLSVSVAASVDSAHTALLEASRDRIDIQLEYKAATNAYKDDKSASNDAEVVRTGKLVQHALIDEVDAWFVLKQEQVDVMQDISSSLRSTLEDDIASNQARLDDLRDDTDAVTNQIELVLNGVKLIVEWVDLIVDVGKNIGRMWVETLDKIADRVELAGGDSGEIDEARALIDDAADIYEEITLQNDPFRKFNTANGKMLDARDILIDELNGVLGGSS